MLPAPYRAEHPAQQPGPRERRNTTKSLTAAPVCCSGWFGGTTALGPNPPCAPADDTGRDGTRSACPDRARTKQLRCPPSPTEPNTPLSSRGRLGRLHTAREPNGGPGLLQRLVRRDHCSPTERSPRARRGRPAAGEARLASSAQNDTTPMPPVSDPAEHPAQQPGPPGETSCRAKASWRPRSAAADGSARVASGDGRDDPTTASSAPAEDRLAGFDNRKCLVGTPHQRELGDGAGEPRPIELASGDGEDTHVTPPILPGNTTLHGTSCRWRSSSSSCASVPRLHARRPQRLGNVLLRTSFRQTSRIPLSIILSTRFQ